MEMDALVAEATGTSTADALSKLRLARIPVPEPKKGQVLVKVHATPCNPADLYYMEGRYGIDRPLPATPGFEGAGMVVKSGGGLLGRWLVGKRVACGGHDGTGTWAEYCVVDAKQCMPLRKDLDFEQGATALANPMTAFALVAMVRGPAYVQTAAAGQLGKMLLAIATDKKKRGIHVVRRADQAAVLRELGAEHVLVSTDDDFVPRLATLAAELGATIAFDAVGGAMTGQLVAAMPPSSDVVIYGALSGQPSAGIDPMRIAFGERRIVGFEIAGHLVERGLFAALRLGSAAQRLVASGRAKTIVRERVSLADAPTRLASYAGAMTDGKLIIVPATAGAAA